MANSGKITEIIDTASTSTQYKTLSDQVDALDAKFVDLTKTVIAFNNAAKDAKGFADFNKNAGQAAIAAEKLLQVQQQTLIVAAKVAEADAKTALALQKVQDARDKNATKQSQQTQKDIQDSQKRSQQSDKEAETIAKNLLKSSQNVDKARRPYNQLNADLERLRDEAKDIGVLFGTSSQAFLDAAERANILDAQIKKIDSTLGQSQRNVGNYASAAFGIVRQLAYVLPGIGIAGIFSQLGDGLVGIFNILKGGESTISLFNKLAKQTNDLYAEQGVKVSLLVKELNSGNVAQDRQREILEELNKVSPTYFGNLKDISDIVTKLPADYDKFNTALSLNARIQAGLSLYTDKYKELLEAQRKLAEQKPESKNNSFAEQFFKTTQAITGTSQAAKIFNNVQREGAEGLLSGSAKLYTSQITNLQRALEELSRGILSDQQKLQANGGDIAGEQITIQERIANNATEQEKIRLQASIDYNNDIVSNDKKSYSARQQALSTSIAAQKQLLGLSLNRELNDISLTNDKKLVINEQYNTDINKLNIEQEKKSKDLRSQAAKDEIALDNQRLERQKKIAENQTLDPQTDYQVRIDALKIYQSSSESLIKNAEQLAVKDAGDNAVKVKTAKEKANTDLLDLQNDVIKKTLNIQKQAREQLLTEFKEGVKLQEEIYKNSENVFLQAGNQRNEAIQQNAEQALASITEQLAQGKIGLQEFNDQKFDIEHQASQESIKTQITTFTTILALQKEFEEDTTSTEKKISDLKIKYSKDVAEQEIGDAEKVRLKRIKNASEAVEIAQAVQELIKTTIDASYNNQIEALQKQADAIDANASQEKSNIENSLLSTQQKAEKEKLIDAQALADKKKIQDQENALKTKQAQFDRAIAIAGIIENTALAAIKVIGEAGILGIPLSAIVAAIGAIQLATALATPIPKYAKGTKNHPGGKAIVGDAGFELVKLPDGNTFLTENKPTLMDLPKGSTVVPHLETINMLQKINYTGGQKVDIRELSGLMRENNRYQKKIADKPISTHRGIGSEMANALKLNDRRNSYFK